MLPTAIARCSGGRAACLRGGYLPDRPILDDMLTPMARMDQHDDGAGERAARATRPLGSPSPRPGRRPVVFVDESHMGARGNEWGATVQALACTCRRPASSLVTATPPFRYDRDLPVGFDRGPGHTDPDIVKFVRTRPHETRPRSGWTITPASARSWRSSRIMGRAVFRWSGPRVSLHLQPARDRGALDGLPPGSDLDRTGGTGGAQ